MRLPRTVSVLDVAGRRLRRCVVPMVTVVSMLRRVRRTGAGRLMCNRTVGLLRPQLLRMALDRGRLGRVGARRDATAVGLSEHRRGATRAHHQRENMLLHEKPPTKESRSPLNVRVD